MIINFHPKISWYNLKITYRTTWTSFNFSIFHRKLQLLNFWYPTSNFNLLLIKLLFNEFFFTKIIPAIVELKRILSRPTIWIILYFCFNFLLKLNFFEEAKNLKKNLPYFFYACTTEYWCKKNMGDCIEILWPSQIKSTTFLN